MRCERKAFFFNKIKKGSLLEYVTSGSVSPIEGAKVTLCTVIGQSIYDIGVHTSRIQIRQLEFVKEIIT